MIKEVRITVPATKAHKKFVKFYVCDICGYQNHDSSTFSHCCLCGRMVCYKGWHESSCTKHDPREDGDYPAKYCTFCYDLKFGKYEAEYQTIVRTHDEALDALDAKIKKESLGETYA